jgi:putative transposase
VALLRHIAIALYTNMLYNTGRVTQTVVKSKNNVTYSCIFYIVWCPKYRRSVLIEDVAERLKQILREVAQETRCDLIELEVMPDHVHVRVGIDPQFGIHRLTNLIVVQQWA